MHLEEELHFMNSNYEEALDALSSPTAIDRFNAARYFIKNSDSRATEQLRIQRRIEKVRHVKMALDKALSNINKLETNQLLTTDLQVDEATDIERKRYLKAEAIDEFSGIILHELAPKLGILKDTLNTEFHSFDSSQSKKCIDNLMQIFKAIEQLRISASAPDSKEVDLAQLIKDILAEEVKGTIRVNLEGSRPYIIKTDPALLSLAISNGIRNSSESIMTLTNMSDDKSITVSWGGNDQEFWVSIIDEGIGVRGNPNEAFTIGNTNKTGHTGFGMGIMRQAIDSLGGTVELSNIESGGAKLILRWGNFSV